MELRMEDFNYYDRLDWVETPFFKAIKLWANNACHLRCDMSPSSRYFYHGQSDIKYLNHEQVKNGKWYVCNLQK